MEGDLKIIGNTMQGEARAKLKYLKNGRHVSTALNQNLVMRGQKTKGVGKVFCRVAGSDPKM